MAKTTGYPLPEGDCYTEDLCPIVICVPNKDEYFHALWGTLHYLATWTAWRNDPDKRGKDAAAAWRFANEAWEIGDRMGCLDELKTDVNAILLLLQSRKDCCDGNITYNTQVIITTDIIPESGDPPETWGDGEPITTWEEWSEYVCYHAHAYVDKLVEHAETLHAAVAIGAVGIGTVGAILAGLTFIGLAIPVAWLIAAGIAAAALYFAEDIFEDSATSIEAARDEIVCAIMLGNDLGQAVDDALSGAQDWIQFFRYIDYDTAQAIIYEGGFEGEYLESETRDDCDCEEHLEGWTWNNGEISHTSGGGTEVIIYHPSEPTYPEGPYIGRVEWHNTGGCNADMAASMWICFSREGAEPNVEIENISFDVSFQFMEFDRDPCDQLELIDFNYRINTDDVQECPSRGGSYTSMAADVVVPELYTGTKNYQVDDDMGGGVANRNGFTIQVQAMSEGHSDLDIIITIDNLEVTFS